MTNDMRYKALKKHVDEWEEISFDLYLSKRNKYGECDQEVAILKGEWKVWNMLKSFMNDDRRMDQLALRYFWKGGDKCATV